MKISVYFDGLTEPKNPGGYGTYGFVVKVDGEVVKRGKGFIGKGAGITNNVCEYIALLRALEYVKEHFPNTEEVRCYGDSMLVINQMRGVWRVRSENLRELHKRASEIAASLAANFEWIPREENAEADALSREAYYEAILQEAKSEEAKKARLERAEKEEMEVEQVGENLYRVKGKYIVNAERMTCTCADFKVRGEICKHIFKILTMKMRRKGENRADRAEGERERACEGERKEVKAMGKEER